MSKQEMNDNFEKLDNRLQRYYTDQSLPPDVLLGLKETIRETEVEFDPGWRWISVRMVPKLNAALAALILLVSIGATTFFAYQQFGNQRIESVAAEIALNHAKQFDSEFFVSSIPNLSHSMSLLDFSPVAPRKMQLTNYVVNGARYCTVDSSIAVQVRLEDENMRSYTLYEFRNTGSLQIKGEQVIMVGDIEVTLWQEGDVTMGLAQRIEKL